jgi:hypothetical protein
MDIQSSYNGGFEEISSKFRSLEFIFTSSIWVKNFYFHSMLTILVDFLIWNMQYYVKSQEEVRLLQKH